MSGQDVHEIKKPDKCTSTRAPCTVRAPSTVAAVFPPVAH